MTAPRPIQSGTAAKLQRAAAAPGPDPEPTAPASRADGGGGDTLKTTWELDRSLHRSLKLHAIDLEVPASAIVRALLRLFDERPEVRALVVAELRP